MDNGMGEANGVNGILMEDEIMGAQAVTQPLSEASPVQQPVVPSPQLQVQQPVVQSVPPQVQQPVVQSVQQQVQQPNVSQPAPSEREQINRVPANDAVKDFLDNGLELPFSMTAKRLAASRTPSHGRKLTKEEVIQILDQVEKEKERADREPLVLDGKLYDKYSGRSSNVLLGLIGAFLGTLIGAAFMVFLDYIDMWSCLGACVLFIFAYKGYVRLGDCMDKKGIVICIMLTAPTVWIANQVGWTLWYIKNVGGAVGIKLQIMDVLPYIYNRLQQLDELLPDDSHSIWSHGIMENYYMDTILSIGAYLFVVVGVVSEFIKKSR